MSAERSCQPCVRFFGGGNVSAREYDEIASCVVGTDYPQSSVSKSVLRHESGRPRDAGRAEPLLFICAGTRREPRVPD